MARLYGVIDKLIDKTIASTVDIPSSRWTASTASYVSGTLTTIGDIKVIALSLQLTSAHTAGTEYNLGTINLTGLSNFSSLMGIHVYGSVTAQDSGLIRIASSKNIVSGARVYPRGIWIGGGQSKGNARTLGRGCVA